MKKLLLILTVFALSGCGVHTVSTGHRGVKVSFGKVESEPLPEGLYFVNPFTTSIEELDTRILRYDGQTEAYTKDVQEATVKFTLNYRLQQNSVAMVYKSVGTDWENKLVPQVVMQDLKDIIGQWDAVDLIANRQKVNDQVGADIKKSLADRAVDSVAFSITDFEFSGAFNHAVEAKVIAQQRALESQNKTEQIKQEANQKVIAAEAEAKSMKIRADALQQNPKLVEWEAVQKWNGELPTYMLGGNSMPFIQLPAK